VLTEYRLDLSVGGGALGQVYSGGALAYVVGGLQPTRKYTVVLHACTSAGCTASAPRLVETSEALPGPVDGPLVSALTARSVTLSWRPPAGEIISHFAPFSLIFA
jgi:hypothetical protein